MSKQYTPLGMAAIVIDLFASNDIAEDEQILTVCILREIVGTPMSKRDFTSLPECGDEPKWSRRTHGNNLIGRS